MSAVPEAATLIGWGDEWKSGWAHGWRGRQSVAQWESPIRGCWSQSHRRTCCPGSVSLLSPPSLCSDPRPKICLFIVVTSGQGPRPPSLGRAALPWNGRALHNTFLQPDSRAVSYTRLTSWREGGSVCVCVCVCVHASRVLC